MLNKVRGALFGLAVGDALGCTKEFTDPTAVPDFPAFATGPQVDVIGAGPFHLEPGAVTDDTHMAVCLTNSLVEKGYFDPDDVTKRYQEWVEISQDCGNLTYTSLLGGGAYRAWEASLFNSAGNGSLMRCAPLGVFYANHPERVLVESLRDATITHYDPRCAIATAVFNSCITYILRENPTSPQRVVDHALSVIDHTAELYRVYAPSVTEEQIQYAVSGIRQDLDFAQQSDPKLYDFNAANGTSLESFTEEDFDLLQKTGGLSIIGTGMGYVRVAFRLAFWELLHAPSFEVALIDVINRGGDSDTNGAITGALLGAYFGYQSIPERWLEVVLNAVLEPPFSTLYHPRNLFNLHPKEA